MTTHEKVILVGVETEKNYQTFSASMEELANLTETANGEVVFVLTQKRPQVDRQTVIGKGKFFRPVEKVEAYAVPEADIKKSPAAKPGIFPFRRAITSFRPYRPCPAASLPELRVLSC